MRKRLSMLVVVSLVSVVIFSLIAGLAIAKQIPMADKAKENTKEANMSPIIEFIGDDVEVMPPGLYSFTFIHYADSFGKKPKPDKPDKGGGRDCDCYSYLGKSVMWKDMPVNYVINPSNNSGLSNVDIADAILAGTAEWDSFVDSGLFGSYAFDPTANFDPPDARDTTNEVSFGDYPTTGVIAVTRVWAYFYGNPANRKILEFDLLFDTDYIWGDASVNPNLMDLQNIATHELGHTIGMGDVYNDCCIEETMYGYSGEGETKKRDLNTADITGIQKLYN